MTKLDDNLLSDFMNGFWGYGNIDADYWFVGMEEGGGNEFIEVEKRINSWDQLSKKRVEDLYEYHNAINQKKWFKKMHHCNQPGIK